jgi:two-component system chemotaxis response regulator CheY
MMQPTIIARRAADRLKVLIAEDDPEAREALEEAVRSLGHACAVAKDGLEAWEMHQANRADVIVADWNMPRLDGIGLCRRLRRLDMQRLDQQSAYAHFIFVTGSGDKAHFIEGMRAGADDYITKPIDIDELEARLEVVHRAVLIQRQGEENNSALRRKSDHDFRAARTDPLTAVSNRLELTEDLELLASRVRTHGHPYSAALCDIDSFKAYNDSFGHLAGDEVLRRVAHTIHQGLRRDDGFYRYGGEEFLAILPEQGLAEAAAGMDRVRKDVEQLRIPHGPGASHPFVTISVGIAELNTDSTGGIQDWLRRADTALYRAKGNGRNCVVAGGEHTLPGLTSGTTTTTAEGHAKA